MAMQAGTWGWACRLLACFCALASAQTAEKPVRAVTDPGVVTTRQSITPAGIQAIFKGRVYGVAFGEGTELWALGAGEVFRFDWSANRLVQQFPLGGQPGLEGIQFDPVDFRALASATYRDKENPPKVRLLAFAKDVRETVADGLGTYLAGALAIAPKTNPQGQRIAVVPLIRDNKLAIVDVTGKRLVGTVATGVAPFGAAINHNGTVAYVTNWGGRVAGPDDLTGPSGQDRVVIDQQGIAATGTVTRLDLAAAKATHTIPVDLHPTAILWDEARARLYVANGNKDTVSVIETNENRVTAGIAIQPFAQRVAGIAPTALAITPDGERLFVACGGINAVAVVATASHKVEGLIPTAWYPNGLSMSADGHRLAISTLLGAGSGWRGEPRKRFVHAYRGSVAVVEIPDKAQLASYTTAVAENNHLAPLSAAPAPMSVAATEPAAVPAKSGDPSLIRHVVYIVKENRTYDQILGDVPKGNGDPSLVMYGVDVTPNQHRLAEEFVLLDNFYASGGNSADGHQWLTQANETDYALWPGFTGRSYPFDGSDAIVPSQGGFIWDAALRMHRTVRVYGEYTPQVRAPMTMRAALLDRWKSGGDFSREWNISSPIPALDKLVARQYPGYGLAIPDVVRARLFLADVAKWEREGSMPNLTILALPCNHTAGAMPGVSSAKAMVADNDLALGQIVEALTRTQFWKQMAIFVVEDDAQDGVDHVDGHRTVALAVSPYVRRGYVDSTFYSNQSMLKAMELMLGLPSLTLFDLIANDMRPSFTNRPDYTGYTAVEPKQSLFELNPQVKALRGPERRAALDSLKMRWDVPDAAPTERLNRILWHQVKGWNTPYPRLRQAVFAPLARDVDDDERDREK